MSPRQRNKKNKGLPPNLYTDNDGATFRYKRPDNGVWVALGGDKAKAISAAKQANSQLMSGANLVAKILDQAGTLAAFIDTYTTDIIPTKELAKATLDNYTISLNSIKDSDLGKKAIDDINLYDITEYLNDFTPRSSNQRRERLIDLFKYAIDRGQCTRTDNPAELKIKQVYKKTRKRHTEQGLATIYNHKETPQWLRNAIDLALITLQRREDLVKIKMPALDAEVIEVIQKKTKKYDTGYLRISIGPELRNVISRCRLSGTFSTLLLHKKSKITEARRKKYDDCTEISPEQITREFKKCVDASEAYKHLQPKERPTFHELRALGIKRYKDKGTDPQALAGHASEQMTKNYDADHDEIRWVEVRTD